MKNYLIISILLLVGCVTSPPQSITDAKLQEAATSELRQQLISQKADCGTLIIMAVATGEIKAMVNLTRQSDSVTTSQVNYATEWLYEPGSTFKLASYIALLEDGVSPDMMVDCGNGQAMIDSIVTMDDTPHGEISLREVFNTSSNIGMAKTVNERFSTKPEIFNQSISAMLPNIDSVKQANIPQSASIIKMAYGYGFEVTPMHMLALYNAVANDGNYISPTFVTRTPEQGKTICSQATLSELRKTSVRVATIPLLGNDERTYYATSIGYFPADNPKYTVFVGIKTTGYNYYGASLALPVFEGITKKIAE